MMLVNGVFDFEDNVPNNRPKMKTGGAFRLSSFTEKKMWV